MLFTQTMYAHFAVRLEFPAILGELQINQHGLEKNALVDDDLSKHLHVRWEVVMSMAHGFDFDFCMAVLWSAIFKYAQKKANHHHEDGYFGYISVSFDHEQYSQTHI